VAADNEKKTYPRLPAKNWWTLRERFKQTAPARVDANYLQSVLDLTSAASAGNLMGPLRTLGLIDEKGAPTERALDWRHDETYSEVCEAIVADVYPDSLRSAFPNPAGASAAVATWFARNTGAGQGAATGMAALFILLSDGDPAAKVNGAKPASGRATKAANATKTTKATKASASTPKPAPEETPRRKDAPSLNINVQVHISSDASPDQIDQIFKSMAEHLYAAG